MLRPVAVNGVKGFYLQNREFSVKGVPFEIVGTELTGPGIMDVIHSVKNKNTGTIAELTMKKLSDIILSNQPGN